MLGQLDAVTVENARMGGMGLPAIQNPKTMGFINENVVVWIVVSCIKCGLCGGMDCGELHKVWFMWWCGLW